MRLKIELSKTDTLKSNISVENYLQKKIILGGKEFTFFYVYESELMNCPYQEPVDFIKRNNGLLLFLSGEEFRIYNDPFRTVPIYVYRDSNFIRIFSNFEDFYLFNGSKDIKVDKPGFWETIIFESGLGRRTLFEGVKQMPAASILKVNKDLSYTIERYWNFSIELNSSIDTLDNAAAGLYERLDSIFGRLPKDKNYLMGLSGGVDSRLTLAMLSKCFKKDRLKLFTYGFDIRILEYIYAKQVANALGFDTPLFHKLTPESYLQCSDELARRSAASIGGQRGHDYYFLHNVARDNS